MCRPGTGRGSSSACRLRLRQLRWASASPVARFRLSPRSPRRNLRTNARCLCGGSPLSGTTTTSGRIRASGTSRRRSSRSNCHNRALNELLPRIPWSEESRQVSTTQPQVDSPPLVLSRSSPTAVYAVPGDFRSSQCSRIRLHFCRQADSNCQRRSLCRLLLSVPRSCR